MKKIAILGYGELGKQFEHLISCSIKNVKFIYFDDLAYHAKVKNSFPFDSFLEDKFSDFNFLIGLGYKHLQTKKKLIDILESRKRNIFTFIHPSAFVDQNATIGCGSVLYPNVTIDKNVHIGKGCLLNLSVTISHDTIINDCCFLAPSVTISGFVSIGKEVFLGTAVCVANGVEIKDFVVVGIGSVITKNIEQNQFVIGNPQKVVKKISLK